MISGCRTRFVNGRPASRSRSKPVRLRPMIRPADAVAGIQHGHAVRNCLDGVAESFERVGKIALVRGAGTRAAMQRRKRHAPRAPAFRNRSTNEAEAQLEAIEIPDVMRDDRAAPIDTTARARRRRQRARPAAPLPRRRPEGSRRRAGSIGMPEIAARPDATNAVRRAEAAAAHRLDQPVLAEGLGASRRRRIWTSTVRSSM